MNDVQHALNDVAPGAEQRMAPTWGKPAVALEPQLVDRTSRAPEGDSWIHEIKYDGYRLLASVQRGTVWLYSRSGADWTPKLPWIAKAVRSLGVRDVHLDGELVYLDDDGFPDVERLWSATRSDEEQGRLYYQLFDVLRLKENDLTTRAADWYRARRASLERRTPPILADAASASDIPGRHHAALKRSRSLGRLVYSTRHPSDRHAQAHTAPPGHARPHRPADAARRAHQRL